MPARFSTSTTLICVLLVLACLGCDRSSPEAKKAKHREQAETYFEKGQYHEALIEYKNVAQVDPKDADAHYRLALTYLKLGGTTNLQGAFAELSRTVELDKTNRDAQLKLGELYLLGNEPAKARKQAEIVLVSAPQNTEGLILKGRSLINEKHYAEGIAELKKAIELDPKNMQTYIDLARAQVFAKDTAAAEQTLKNALTIDSRSAEILLALGDFRVTTGKPDQAEIIYKQALEIAPENEEIFLRLASVYQRSGKWTDVETTLQKLAALKPQDEKPHIHLGDFFTWLGQRDKALASYQRATEVNPSSVIARDKLISHYLDTGKTSEAEAKVKDILEKNNKDLMGRFFDARIRLAKNNSDEAISLLQGVVKDEPQFAGAHYFLGVAFLQKHQMTQARSAFTEAVKLNPKLAEARTALAKIHLAEGSADLAIEQAQAAIQLNPRNVQAAVIAGDAYLLKGDVAKSKQVFEAIAKALPNEPLGPYRLGLVARAEKNEAKALAYFEEALSKKQGAIEPLTQIAMIKFAQGKADEARERVNKQIEASPKNPLFYTLLGQLWMRTKDAGRAEIAFKKAIELDDSLLSAYMNLAQVYHLAGKTDQAVKEYEAILVKNPKVIQAHMLLGVIHESRNEYDKAQAQYEAILKLAPRFAPAANNLAWLMAEQGRNLDVALSHAQTAREGRPDDPHIADTLGWIYYKKNAYLLAVSLLKEAAEKLPNEPIVHFHHGMAQYKNGNPVGAKKSLQAALKLNQSFPGSEEAKKTLAGL
ncbi:MAG TPA: tetratricopeptide repeat protein [Nitrospiraceae bacterium]|jgi:tetratricopeptide (TPR) repeat protein|nr:tetratricopeptide repeat protein [Nitrospiraceae bacterium]